MGGNTQQRFRRHVEPMRGIQPKWGGQKTLQPPRVWELRQVPVRAAPFRGPAGASLQGQPLCRGLKGPQWQRGNDKVSGHAGPCVLCYNHPVRGARRHPRASQTPAPGLLVLAGGPCMPSFPPWPSFSVRQEGARYGGDTSCRRSLLPALSSAGSLCPPVARNRPWGVVGVAAQRGLWPWMLP